MDRSGTPDRSRLEALDRARVSAAERARLTAEEPTAIFGLLALNTPPRDALERLSRRVDAALDRTPRRTGRWRAVAAVAAALILAGIFAVELPGPDDPPTRVDMAEIHRLLDRHAPVRSIELLSSPGTAEVVDFAVGDTEVVMIFDEKLGI
jgi:hypothetical protein